VIGSAFAMLADKIKQIATSNEHRRMPAEGMPAWFMCTLPEFDKRS
jgi:hypothetical protein